MIIIIIIIIIITTQTLAPISNEPKNYSQDLIKGKQSMIRVFDHILFIFCKETKNLQVYCVFSHCRLEVKLNMGTLSSNRALFVSKEKPLCIVSTLFDEYSHTEKLKRKCLAFLKQTIKSSLDVICIQNKANLDGGWYLEFITLIFSQAYSAITWALSTLHSSI